MAQEKGALLLLGFVVASRLLPCKFKIHPPPKIITSLTRLGKQRPLLREDYRYLLALWELHDNFKKPYKSPHPRQSILSLTRLGKQPPLLREDYRYLLALWELLDNFKKPYKSHPPPQINTFTYKIRQTTPAI